MQGPEAGTCWRRQRTSKKAGGGAVDGGAGVRPEGVARVQITTWTCYLHGPHRVITGTR